MVKDNLERLINNNGTKSVDTFHQQLGLIMWEKCGMSRNAQGLNEAIGEIAALKDEFWKEVKVPGELNEMNVELEKAGRLADYFELGLLMCKDALQREESCGGHFREEHQTEEGEAMRNDNDFAFVAAWEYKGDGEPELHKEELIFENVELKTRSYK